MRERHFLRFWAGSTISVTGSGLSAVAIPLIAVQQLSATPAQMGVLFAAGTTASLVLRIPAAAWSDRSASTLKVVALGQLASGLLVAIVPILWSVSLLTYASLVAVVAALHAASAIVDAFAAPTIPRLVPRAELTSAYGRFSASRNAANVAGPALAGSLLQVLAAPLLLVLDALSFFIAALLTRSVRLSDREPSERSRAAGAPSDLWAVMRVPFLRRSLLVVLYASLANGAASALLVLFMVRQLDLAPSAVGTVLGIGAAGGVLAGVFVGRIRATLGLRTMTTMAGLLMVGSLAGLPLAQPGWSGLAACLVYELAGSFGAALMVITIFSEIPDRIASTGIARAMAIANLVPELSATFGALLGGVVASATSIRATLWASLILAIVASLVTLALARYSKPLPTTQTLG